MATLVQHPLCASAFGGWNRAVDTTLCHNPEPWIEAVSDSSRLLPTCVYLVTFRYCVVKTGRSQNTFHRLETFQTLHLIAAFLGSRQRLLHNLIGPLQPQAVRLFVQET